MNIIAIDGACRRNGKPDCVSSGGVFIMRVVSDEKTTYRTLSAIDTESTNQRGELLALIQALEYLRDCQESAMIITDSEYLFNTMTKEWFIGWESRRWLTSTGTPVKNADLWCAVKALYAALTADVIFYHIKGHCISVGDVTARKSLTSDNTGLDLYQIASKKYDISAKPDKLADANELSLKNNGYTLDADTLKRFIVMNTVVDAVATKAVIEADSRP